MRVLPAGDRATLIELGVPQVAAAVADRLRTAGADILDDVVAAECTVMVFARRGVPAAHVRELLDRVAASRTGDSHGGAAPEVRIPVRYDGADLDAVAHSTGLGRAGLIEWHTSSAWTCDFIGFAPGFGYLSRAGDDLCIARHTQSRAQVPAGAVALAGKYSAIYPRSSPGGWQLIGTTDRPVWDIHAAPPALMAAGTRIHFSALDE